MKIRTSFVSNSSSSSFIAVIDDKKDMCPNCKKILECFFTIRNARDYIENECGWDSWEEFLEDQKTSKYPSILEDAVRNNKDILDGSAEYGAEEPYEELLNILGYEYKVD